jgi:hypothetical protein
MSGAVNRTPLFFLEPEHKESGASVQRVVISPYQAPDVIRAGAQTADDIGGSLRADDILPAG